MKGHGMKILCRLLLRDVSAAQIAVYAVGTYIGLIILAGAMQLWRDFSTPAAGLTEDPFASGGYVVMSPKVEGLGLTSESVVPDSVLDALRQQPWTVSADRFSASDFSVTASVGIGPESFSSALFFESVPDSYIRPLPDAWTFDPADPAAVIPVIIPRDYLALYNFGFAPSRGLPSLGEDVIMQIPLSVSVAGRGLRCDFPARIAGFSSRINTIAVPDAFLSWANNIYGTGHVRAGSPRLIAQVSTDAADPAIRSFAASHSLEIAGDDGSASYSRILAVVLSAVTGVGLLLCLLSVVVLSVSLILLLYKCREVIVRLVALGFDRSVISGIYFTMLAVVNLAVWIACAATLAVGHSLISPLLHDAAVGSAPLAATMAASFLLMTLLQLTGMAIIRKKTESHK